MSAESPDGMDRAARRVRVVRAEAGVGDAGLAAGEDRDLLQQLARRGEGAPVGAFAQAQLGGLLRALDLGEEALAFHPAQGHLATALGRLEDALAAYDRAVQLEPNYFQAHFNRGNVLDALNPKAGAELRDMDQAAMAREVDERTVPGQAHAPA